MQLAVSSKTIPYPWTNPRDTTRKGKNPPPPPTLSLCTKTLPSGQNRESKAPPPGHKVRKFHKCIYKLWHCSKWKAMWSQQILIVFQWGDWLLNYISLGCHQSETMESIKALYDMYKCILIIFKGKGAWKCTKNISNFCRFLLIFFS